MFMYKIFLSIIGSGSRRVRPYIERVEADTLEEAEGRAKLSVEEMYPGSKVIVDEVYLKVK